MPVRTSPEGDAQLPMSTPARATVSERVVGSILRWAPLTVSTILTAWIIGARPPEAGTDTQMYARFYEMLGRGPVETRLEPGFVIVSSLARSVGLPLFGYQFLLAMILACAVLVAVWSFWRSIGAKGGWWNFVHCSAAFLLLSPVFSNASINAIRQGLASFLIIGGILAVQRKAWITAIALSLLATAFHFSSAIFLPFLFVLGVRPRWQALILALHVGAYLSGVTRSLVRAMFPSAYRFVMDYNSYADYEAGIRWDFALFTFGVYLLLLWSAQFCRSDLRPGYLNCLSVYLVMSLPFFWVGWGNFSNRYLLPAWLAVSLFAGFLTAYSRIKQFREPAVLLASVAISVAVFAHYVANGIVA